MQVKELIIFVRTTVVHNTADMPTLGGKRTCFLGKQNV